MSLSKSSVLSEHNVEQAYKGLCQQRKHFPPNSDVWHLRFHWEQEKHAIVKAIQNDDFYFKPLQRVTKANGEVIHLWSAVDSLVLKLLSSALADILPNSSLCTHIKAHGGAKQTVNAIYQQCKTNTFVFRTDVKSYYDSIDHQILIDKLSHYIQDKWVLNLLTQYVKRSIEIGGNFIDVKRGISAGCPLSPLIASFFLYELDRAMEKKVSFYRRYMDDIIVLTKSRWQLRRAILCVNQYFERLGLAQHPDKTFIGRIAKGFDFLGYQFGKYYLTPSKRTQVNHTRLYLRLYEQKKSHPQWMAFLDKYRQRWLSWVYAGINVPVKLNDVVLPLNLKVLTQKVP